MGIARGATHLLIVEAKRRAFEGTVLTLGRQDVWLGLPELANIAREHDYVLSADGPAEISDKPAFAAKGYLSDAHLLRALGFSDVQSLDVSGYERATHLHDLSSRDLAPELVGAFDVVIDGGTVEHVFHTPNALWNLFRLLKVGGRVIHFTPSSNYMDHGYYAISPVLLCDFYSANAFELNTTQVIAHTPAHWRDAWEVSEYTPGCLGPVAYGGLDSRMYGAHVVATKTPRSSGDVIPQQGHWVRTCLGCEAESGTQRWSSRVRQRLAAHPAVYRLAVMGWRAWQWLRRRRKGSGLKVIARY